MLDSFFHMTLKFLFGVKTQHLAIFYATLKWTSLSNVIKSVNPSGLLILLHGIISLPDWTLCNKKVLSMTRVYQAAQVAKMVLISDACISYFRNIHVQLSNDSRCLFLHHDSRNKVKHS